MYLQKISTQVSFACDFHCHLSCKKTRNLFANLPQIYLAACLLGQSGHCFSVNSPGTCMKRHSAQLISRRGQFLPVPFITLPANYYQRQNRLNCGKELPNYLAARLSFTNCPFLGRHDDNHKLQWVLVPDFWAFAACPPCRFARLKGTWPLKPNGSEFHLLSKIVP